MDGGCAPSRRKRRRIYITDEAINSELALAVEAKPVAESYMLMLTFPTPYSSGSEASTSPSSTIALSSVFDVDYL